MFLLVNLYAPPANNRLCRKLMAGMWRQYSAKHLLIAWADGPVPHNRIFLRFQGQLLEY
jgi:hypothetical protein